MKTNVHFLIITLFLISSCKKSDSYDKENNPTKGKLKEQVAYSSINDTNNQISRFYYLYDSITGALQTVIGKGKTITNGHIQTLL